MKLLIFLCLRLVWQISDFFLNNLWFLPESVLISSWYFWTSSWIFLFLPESLSSGYLEEWPTPPASTLPPDFKISCSLTTMGLLNFHHTSVWAWIKKSCSCTDDCWSRVAPSAEGCNTRTTTFWHQDCYATRNFWSSSFWHQDCWQILVSKGDTAEVVTFAPPPSDIRTVMLLG